MADDFAGSQIGIDADWLEVDTTDAEPSAETAAAFHLPGQHDQRTHGHRGAHSQIPDDPFSHGGPIGHVADLAALWHRDLTDLHGLVDLVESGPTDDSTRLAGGQFGETWVTRFHGGGYVVTKITKDATDTLGDEMTGPRQSDAEQMGSLLGRAVRAPVPRVLRVGDEQLEMEYVEGIPSSLEKWELEMKAEADGKGEDAGTEEWLSRTRARMASPDGVRIGLMHLLGGHWDGANPSNVMILDDGSPVSIDHSFLWTKGGDFALPREAPTTDAMSPWARVFVQLEDGSPSSTRLDTWTGHGEVQEWAPNPLTKADVEWLRQRIADSRKDFQVIDRDEWWQFVHARFEAIAEHASGTQNLFAPLHVGSS